MITEKDIIKAYEEYYKAFDNCAKAEDNFSELKNKFTDAKENTPTKTTLQNKLEKMQPQVRKAQRALRFAASEIEKMKLLINIGLINSSH